MSLERRREIEKLRRRVDPEYREKHIRSVLRARGRRVSDVPIIRASFNRTEVAEMAGVNRKTLLDYHAYGIIPPTTYPGPTEKLKARYWRHQAVLVIKLFARMRSQGWPDVIPHMIGDAGWTQYLDRLRSEWPKEAYDERQAGNSVYEQIREDGARQRYRPPDRD